MRRCPASARQPHGRLDARLLVEHDRRRRLGHGTVDQHVRHRRSTRARRAPSTGRRRPRTAGRRRGSRTPGGRSPPACRGAWRRSRTLRPSSAARLSIPSITGRVHGVRELRQHHADAAGAPRAQGAGERVGRVAQLAAGLEHPLRRSRRAPGRRAPTAPATPSTGRPWPARQRPSGVPGPRSQSLLPGRRHLDGRMREAAHHRAAVDDHLGAGDERRPVGEQKRDHLGDLGRVADPLHRGQRRLAGEPVARPRPDRPGCRPGTSAY